MYKQFFLYESPTRKVENDKVQLKQDLTFQKPKQVSDQCIPLPTILDQGLTKPSIDIQEKSNATEKIQTLETINSAVKITEKPEMKEQNKTFEVISLTCINVKLRTVVGGWCKTNLLYGSCQNR